MDKFIPKSSPLDHSLQAYRFDLPQELIAQEPPKERGASRLLVYDRRSDATTITTFSRLADYLPPSLIVVNNSRVVPARIFGNRESGGKVEFLLTTPLPHIQEKAKGELWEAEVDCLLKSSKKVRIGESVRFAEDFYATILERGEYGQCRAKLHWTGRLPKRLCSQGVMPLPPYIKRPQSADDANRYQTIYAKKEKNGSIAAPTAGLHFTVQMKEELARQGFVWAEITLYVGYGTFSPVRCDDLKDHVMHREYCEISPETAALTAEAKKKGLPITAVGTTAARTLEGVVSETGEIAPFQGWTNIFLYPGKPVRAVDHLVTNFHLPESTLLMLVSAFAGRDPILNAYAKAVKEGFRFFSYGDAMLIL